MKQKNQTTTKQSLIAEMKNRRGINTLILFRNGDNFEAYDKDAATITQTLTLKSFIEDELETVRFPASKVEDYSNKLLDAGLPVCISEMRNESGNFTPNVAVEDE